MKHRIRVNYLNSAMDVMNLTIPERLRAIRDMLLYQSNRLFVESIKIRFKSSTVIESGTLSILKPHSESSRAIGKSEPSEQSAVGEPAYENVISSIAAATSNCFGLPFCFAYERTPLERLSRA
jgi:hypothetical protein